MLHSSKPEAFVSNEYLHRQWTCLNCDQSFVFGNGFVGLCHYNRKETQTIEVGLICFCSTECLLDFEPISKMGKA